MRKKVFAIHRVVTVCILMGLLLCCPVSYCQVQQQWAYHYDGSGGADYARDMITDANGNSYMTGTSTGNGSGMDIVTVKCNLGGEQLWEARFNGEDNRDDWGYSLVLDSDGNVYAAGSSYFSDRGKDFALVKYNQQGEQQWVRFYNGSADRDDEVSQVVVDREGNAIITGTSQGTDTRADYATVKFSPDGEQLWAVRYNGTSDNVDEARAMAVDDDGNVYVSGGSFGDETDYDYATIKYNSNGAEQWVERYDGPGHDYDVVFYAGSVKLDRSANVYITGYSTGADGTYDYATLKYSTDGALIWVDRYNGPAQGTDYADALALDDLGNVYITGGSFDSTSSYDYVTIKYNSDGERLWTASFNGTGNDWDEAYGIAFDPSGNVYIAGRCVGDGSSADFATVKYSSSGEELWNIRYNGSANNYEWPFRIQLDADTNVYVGGWSTESGAGADYTIIQYHQMPDSAPGLSTFTPDKLHLLQNYPNPFNATTTIGYVLPVAGNIQLSVFDYQGRHCATLVNTHQQVGKHNLEVDFSPYSSGLYYFRLEASGSLLSGSLILLK